MNNFEFHRPTSTAEAARAIGAASDGRFLAGGQSLLGAMNWPGGAQRPDRPVRNRRPARHHDAGRGDPHRRDDLARTVAASADVQRNLPALARLADGIGDPAIRSLGTLGGSVAENDPASCYPAAVLGLGATVHTDRRSIPGDSFFTGLYGPALAPGEIITAISFRSRTRPAT